MSLFSCECNCRCTIFAIIASVIIGVVTALLTITAVITLTPAFLWVLFGIAIGTLIVILAISPQLRASQCVCNALSLLLIGILGTIPLSIILLAITFAATSILGAIIAGLLLLFFSLTVTSTVCLVKLLADCDN